MRTSELSFCRSRSTCRIRIHLIFVVADTRLVNLARTFASVQDDVNNIVFPRSDQWTWPCLLSHENVYAAGFLFLQVVSNVILGRSHIGVHWRMDGVYGALMGETSAVRRLQEVRKWLIVGADWPST